MCVMSLGGKELKEGKKRESEGGGEERGELWDQLRSAQSHTEYNVRLHTISQRL